MIDRDARKMLSKNLKALVEGTITTDQFFRSMPLSGEDRATKAIWGYGDALYSDITEYTLKGRYAVDNETKDLVQRCILFLETDLEYMWPDQPESFGINVVLMGFALGVIGVILNIIAQTLNFFFYLF